MSGWVEKRGGLDATKVLYIYYILYRSIRSTRFKIFVECKNVIELQFLYKVVIIIDYSNIVW